MNQLVAPTSFITSTSRRRAKIERRIVFATRAIDASVNRIARPAVTSFTSPVADRIFFVSCLRFRTSSMAGNRDGGSAAAIALMPSGSRGTSRNESGSGFEPSRANASRLRFCMVLSACCFEMYCTLFTFGNASSCWCS